MNAREQAQSQLEDEARDEFLDCAPAFLEWFAENAADLAPVLVAAYCGAFTMDPRGENRERFLREAVAQTALMQAMHDYITFRVDDEAIDKRARELMKEEA